MFALDLTDALLARGHAVETVALVPAVGGEPLDLPVLGGAGRASGLRRLRDTMRRHDVAVAHGSSTGPACAIAGFGIRTPFVYRQISDSRFWAPTRARRLRVRAALSRARLVVALSEHSRADLVDWIGVTAERIRVIPNGVPVERFPAVDEEARRSARAGLGIEERHTVLNVGALVAEKGVDRAVECVAGLQDAQLLVAGDGPERAALEALAAERAPGRVRFLGSVADVVPAYHAADVLVFPARGGDSMPAALIEAGLCGLPAVATGLGAVADVVLDGVTGLVVSPDDPAAFERSVASLLEEPERRAAFGRAARAHCRARFDIATVAARWEEALEEAVGRR